MCLLINVPELGERMNFRKIRHPRKSKALNRYIDDLVKVTEEDVHYYKILCPVGKSLYRTPYRNFEVTLNTEINSNKHISVDDYSYTLNSLAICYGIHMLTDLELAKSKCKKMDLSLIPAKPEVFDCIIPKGTRYVLGNKCDAVAEKVIIRKMNE